MLSFITRQLGGFKTQLDRLFKDKVADSALREIPPNTSRAGLSPPATRSAFWLQVRSMRGFGACCFDPVTPPLTETSESRGL